MVRLLRVAASNIEINPFCFNSSMVRLLPKGVNRMSGSRDVSIPQWYDYYSKNIASVKV